MPYWILNVFIIAENDSASYQQLLDKGIVVMRIMAVFIAFDAMYLTFTGALKGPVIRVSSCGAMRLSA